MKGQTMQQPRRIRLNQELRNKIVPRFKVHLEQEDTQERSKYYDLRNVFKSLQDKTWKLAESIVRRQYPQEDIKTAHYLQDKYENVDTIAKDSCFHFGYMGKDEEGKDEHTTKHFDFKIDGDIDGIDRQGEDRDFKSADFAYAYFRDDIKGQENCNPDINIEMRGKDRNPHQQKFQDANNKFLGTYSSCDEGRNRFAREWNDEYKLDLIGREYCRDRQIPCSKQEFDTLMIWQTAKGQLIMAHEKWVESILKQTKFIKDVIKNYKYLDEAVEFAVESGIALNEAEIIRVNSTGLTLYNPKNASEMLKSMKNLNVSREDKILARVEYEKQQKQQQAIN
jgi:hypothetical protein